MEIGNIGYLKIIIYHNVNSFIFHCLRNMRRLSEIFGGLRIN